jgi:colanic acid/amylovoran biosynthesis glycosyltransferase
MGRLDGHEIAIVLKGYPRLSETFIAQEIEGLERTGARIRLFSLRHPTDRHRHPVHDRIRASVTYLPEYLYQEPLRVLHAWWQVMRWPAYREAFRCWWRDFRRDPTANRGRRFGQALVLAAEMGERPELLYSHFLHTPCSVTRYAARLLGLPFAISAHAKDIYTIPSWEAAEKLDEAVFTVTCTAGNAEHLRRLSQVPERIHLVYHGLELSHFEPAAHASDAGTLRLLTVGRAVEKKGLDTIIAALALLPAGLDWRWDHVGGGELLPALKAEAERLGLSPRITWHGALPQPAILPLYRQADLFLLASRVTDSGDRDGLPNVLMEAASQAVPALATPVGAIPEFIEDGITGYLVESGNPAILAQRITALAAEPQALEQAGQAALERLRAEFAFDHCLQPLLQVLEDALQATGGAGRLDDVNAA